MGISTYEDITGWVDYDPDVEDNLDEPVETRCTLQIKPMSHAEVKEFGRRLAPVVKAMQSGNRERLEKHRQYIERVLTERVRDVKNLVWRGVEITTGQELARNGHPEVVNDCIEAISDISYLTEQQKKKSRSAPDSFKATTPHSSGVAVDASGLAILEA